MAVVVVVTTAVSLWLRARGYPWLVADMVYDDAYFARSAGHLLEGNWLGPHDMVTLSKGPTYPLFIAGAYQLHVPLKLAEHALHLLAGATLAWAAWRVTRVRLDRRRRLRPGRPQPRVPRVGGVAGVTRGGVRGPEPHPRVRPDHLPHLRPRPGRTRTTLVGARGPRRRAGHRGHAGRLLPLPRGAVVAGAGARGGRARRRAHAGDGSAVAGSRRPCSPAARWWWPPWCSPEACSGSRPATRRSTGPRSSPTSSKARSPTPTHSGSGSTSARPDASSW